MVTIQKMSMKNRPSFSLEAKFVLTGKYEVGYECLRGWSPIYFTPNGHTDWEAACAPENLIGYVDLAEECVFILAQYQKMFQDDTSEYGLVYISVPSLQEEILQYAEIENVAAEFSALSDFSGFAAFSDIVWIDDDFLYDENLPFDFESFRTIDEGVRYLNPKHFSVHQFVTL